MKATPKKLGGFDTFRFVRFRYLPEDYLPNFATTTGVLQWCYGSGSSVSEFI